MIRLFPAVFFCVAASCAGKAISDMRPATASGQPSPGSIDEISLDRACFGCSNAYKLTFRRDGTAIRTLRGYARGEPLDRSFKGTVTPDDFVALAALVQQQGFFDLNETYSTRRVDGEWATTSVAVDGRQKAVLNRNRAGPPTLKAIETAIDTLAEKVAWTKAPP